MADNIEVLDASGVTETVRATDNAGVKTPHHNVDAVVPGTGATNLGKAQDSVPGATDTCVPILAVRKDTPANVAGTDGDYERLQMSGGRLHTSGVEALTTPIAENVASTGAGSNVGFSSATLRSGVIVCSAPSDNVDNVFVHLASETGAIGIELEPGAHCVLPPVSNANAWEAHFVAAAPDTLYITGS
jgi:hypothetical protein